MSTATARLAIGYVNHAIGGTAAATTSMSGYPASNLADRRLISARHRSESAALTSQSLDMDLGTARNIDVMGLLGVNYTDAATVTPVLSNASNYTSPVHAPGAQDAFAATYPALADLPSTPNPLGGRNAIYVPGTTQSARYARMTVSDSGNTDGYLQTGVLWAGPLWQPGVNKGFDWQIQAAPTAEPGLETHQRVHRFSLKGITLAERAQLDSIWRSLLRNGRMLLVPRPLDEDSWEFEVIYGVFEEAPVYVAMDSYPEVWSTSLTIREVVD